MKYLILISGWNCSQFVKGCLESVKAQTLQDFKVIIINDCSTDNTLNEILVNKLPEWDVVNNTERMGGFYNFDTWTRKTQGYEICVPLCLDDKLMPDALERIDKEYQKGAWLTYGTWINKDGAIFDKLHYSDEIHRARDYRKDLFRCTGIRTYYKWLYELTTPYIMDRIERNNYYDLEYTWQMQEMCGKERMGVITVPTYEYNNHNPNSTRNLVGFERDKYNEIANRPKKDLLIK